jgi:transcriptional regulator with XRE-family HTH domain
VEKRPVLVDYSAAVNMAFGAKLRRARRSQNITQGELASRVNLSRVTVATIEGGKQNTQLHHVFLFAQALDVPLQELIPNHGEVEKQRVSAEKTAGGMATISDLFLQDARALLLQMKKDIYEMQSADKT